MEYGGCSCSSGVDWFDNLGKKKRLKPLLCFVEYVLFPRFKSWAVNTSDYSITAFQALDYYFICFFYFIGLHPMLVYGALSELEVTRLTPLDN